MDLVTPTCVGKSFSLISGMHTKTGSPPRMWGKVLGSKSICRSHRITPTRVGKRCTPALRRTFRRITPHACGEKT